MLNVCNIYTNQQQPDKKTKKKETKKQNMVMKTYKELLGTCIKSKKQHT